MQASFQWTGMLLFMSRAKAYAPRRASLWDARVHLSKTCAWRSTACRLRTREAMLTGIRSHEIIVGAYSDRAGGVCPMLAAHRCGGRTSFISFARAWDRFARAKRAARRRRAS